MNFPKHKPAPLDGRRPGARDDLYDRGMKNWEGVEAARTRVDTLAETIGYRVRIVRNHFDIAGDHIQEVNPETTRKAIARVRRLIGANSLNRAQYAEELAEMDKLEETLS